jgi:hypothetical protein
LRLYIAEDASVKKGILRRLYNTDTSDVNNMVKTVKASVVMKDLDKVSVWGGCNVTANDMFTPASFTGKCSGASKMTVNVSTEKMSLKASGASKIQISANVTGDTEMKVSGTSNIQGEIKSNKIKFDASGSSGAGLTGTANDISIDLSGASGFNAGDLNVQTAKVDLSGACSATINVANTLKGDLSGASTVKYKGSPNIKVHSSGASKVKKI